VIVDEFVQKAIENGEKYNIIYNNCETFASAIFEEISHTEYFSMAEIEAFQTGYYSGPGAAISSPKKISEVCESGEAAFERKQQ
jgi:hypothetical protein